MTVSACGSSVWKQSTFGLKPCRNPEKRGTCQRSANSSSISSWSLSTSRGVIRRQPYSTEHGVEHDQHEDDDDDDSDPHRVPRLVRRGGLGRERVELLRRQDVVDIVAFDTIESWRSSTSGCSGTRPLFRQRQIGKRVPSS